MFKVTLTKWGNSIGVRIPATVLQKAHLTPGEQLEISVNKQGKLTLSPIHNVQEGWTEAFNAIADAGGDEILVDVPNDFDKEDWIW